MPFQSLPAEGFLNRENELKYLRGLPELKGNALGGDVFLAGARGMGKTELLKQHYRALFREDKAVPFYYSFRTANLKGTYFAKDYFTRFIRQFVSFAKKDPCIALGVAEPLQRLRPVMSALGLHWLIECIEDFQERLDKDDSYWQVVSAISTPAIAAQKCAKPVIVMLDDFDAAGNLYEASHGDAQGLTSLFGESMASSLCPHIVTGAAEALETIVADQSLIGMMEQVHLGPLPEDLATALFRTHLAKLKITCTQAEPLRFLNTLRGNPLYIRNLAKAARKMQKENLAERDLIECYSFDVSEGETAFYWSSVFSRTVKDRTKIKAMIKLLMHAMEDGGTDNRDRQSVSPGLYEVETQVIVDAIRASGMIRGGDAVLRDFIHCLYMKEIEGRKVDFIKEKIAANYRLEIEEECFELVIPMSSNAELVVAKAVEQIGKNIDLDNEFLKSLQLALIEVCINAMEHSGSYEKKVFLKFIIRPDKLEIIVENSGRAFSLDSHTELPVDEKLRMGLKRGWGFKLVYGVMDSVKVERAGDRTRVILTKDIKDNEGL